MKRLLAPSPSSSPRPAHRGRYPGKCNAAGQDVNVEEYDAYEQFAAGDAEPCVSWAGTFHEVRSGEIKLVTVTSGPQAGEVHLNGVIAGFIPSRTTRSRSRSSGCGASWWALTGQPCDWPCTAR